MGDNDNLVSATSRLHHQECTSTTLQSTSSSASIYAMYVFWVGLWMFSICFLKNNFYWFLSIQQLTTHWDTIRHGIVRDSRSTIESTNSHLPTYTIPISKQTPVKVHLKYLLGAAKPAVWKYQQMMLRKHFLAENIHYFLFVLKIIVLLSE